MSVARHYGGTRPALQQCCQRYALIGEQFAADHMRRISLVPALDLVDLGVALRRPVG